VLFVLPTLQKPDASWKIIILGLHNSHLLLMASHKQPAGAPYTFQMALEQQWAIGQ
jgi:hypothetical protein